MTSAGPRRRGRSDVADRISCPPEEVEALKQLAVSRTAGIWRIKRAKIILGTLEGSSPEELMWSVRVPVESVVRFQRTFSKLRLAAFDQPSRKPTEREAAAERMLELLESPPPRRSPLWTTTKVHYIGRDYTLREIVEIRSLLRRRASRTRAEIARELCEVFGLRQATGRLRTAIATNVLVRMAMDNLIALPEPRPRRRRAGRSVLEKPGTAEEGPSLSEAETRHLALLPVEGPLLSRVWREALESYHYLEQHRLFGAQLRYLVLASSEAPLRTGQPDPPSKAGSLLGVLGFSSAAWRLTARDEFIGWTDEERKRNLELVVGNARFLILPWVRVKCLASRILSAAVRRLPSDWDVRYGYRPVLLETFVQLDRFSGTCYRVANWLHVGTTRGYSVRGAEARSSEPPRAIFLYPLRKDFRARLTGEKDRRSPSGTTAEARGPGPDRTRLPRTSAAKEPARSPAREAGPSGR